MFDLLFVLGLIATGYIIGTWAERRHYRSIERREREFIRLPAVTLKKLDAGSPPVESAVMVCGSAVVSVDYFKRILASLRNIFGGTVKSYESLIDRARREAVLRMKASAEGTSLILNVRIETSAIGRYANKKGVASIEALAYGTAVTFKREGAAFHTG